VVNALPKQAAKVSSFLACNGADTATRTITGPLVGAPAAPAYKLKLTFRLIADP